jgi:hypothetical protein
MKRLQNRTYLQTKEINAASSYQDSVWRELAMLRCGVFSFQPDNNAHRLGLRTGPQIRAALQDKHAPTTPNISKIWRMASTTWSALFILCKACIRKVGASQSGDAR